MAGRPSQTPATLCNLCEEISFQDATHNINNLRVAALGISEQGELLKIGAVRHDSLPDFPGLRLSADNGCDFCSFLRGALLKRQPKIEDGIPVDIHMGYIWGSGFDYMQIYGLTSLEVTLYSDGKELLQVILDISAEDRDVAKHLQVAYGPRQDALCDENVKMLKDALDHCSKTCHPIGDDKETFLPTRLIDLGPSNGSKQPRLVVVAEDISPADRIRLHYAALSYCWGTKEDASRQYITTTSALPGHCRQIDISKMSKVMRDAAEVCRRLSIRYLWIDAVCIVQDNTLDWQHESQHMGEVYHHAMASICVAATNSCHESFLDRSKAQASHSRICIPFASMIKPNIVGTFTIWDVDYDQTLQFDEYEARPTRLHFVRDSLFRESVMSRWASRAWVFQERHLSTRMILFGENFVHFMCPKAAVDESGLKLSPEIDTFLHKTATDADGNNFFSVMDRWRMLTHMYAGTLLTQPSDRLPALSGLASACARRLNMSGKDYVAGMWRTDTFICDLFWVREETNCPQTLAGLLAKIIHPEPYVAPSWSWAALPVVCTTELWRFEFSRDIYSTKGLWQSEIESLDLTADIDGLNPFGRILSSRIHGRGKRYPLTAAMGLERLQNDLGYRGYKVLEHGDEGRVRYIAHCQTDWQEDPAIGLQHRRLELLLLASVCTERLRGHVEDCDIESYDADVSRKVNMVEEGDLRVCDSCTKPAHNRSAWGLLVTPDAKDPHIVYRVGLFTSRAPLGKEGSHFGKRLFDSVEFSNVEIR